MSVYFNEIKWGDPNNTTLIVQSGTYWESIYRYINGTGKGVVGPECSSVGVAGFLLGGGISSFSPRYGLGIDQVLDINLILANGSYLQASRNIYSDLFWGLSGGGGGNFGVVTSFTLKTFDMKFSGFFYICYNMSQYKTILDKYRVYFLDAEAEMAYNNGIFKSSGRHNFCIYLYPNNITDYGAFLEFVKPFTFNATSISFTNYTSIPIDPDTPDPLNYLYDKSMVIDNITGYNDEMIEILANTSMEIIPTWELIFEIFGKGVKSFPEDYSVFPHRSKAGVLQLKCFWPVQQDTVLGEKVRKAADDFWAALGAFNKGAYINYIDPGLKDWSVAYYENNYERVKEIKQRVDPNNFFWFDQAIGAQ
jgi:hypothetical protein